MPNSLPYKKSDATNVLPSGNKNSIVDSLIALASSIDVKRDNRQPVLNRDGNKPNWIKEKLRTGILPFSYDAFGSRLVDAFIGDDTFREGIKSEQDKSPMRKDAWLMYLGYPQENNTFVESKYRPSNSDANSKYYSFRIDPEYVLSNVIGAYNESMPMQKVLIDNAVMGRYTVGKGYDKERGDAYVSIYDKWDFPINEYIPDGIAGKPFEIYDRFYKKDLEEYLHSQRAAGKITNYNTYNRLGANLRDYFINKNDLNYDESLDNGYNEALLRSSSR